MALNPTPEKPHKMQTANKPKGGDKKLEEIILASPEGNKELVRRLSDPQAPPSSKKTSKLIWRESRSWAAEILAQQGDKKYFPLLEKLTEDEDPAVRLQAIEGIGNLKSKKAFKLLEKLLQEGSVSINDRRLAMMVLGKIWQEKAISHLVEGLGKPELLGSAALALFNIGSEQAISHLIELWDNSGSDYSIRKEILVALDKCWQFLKKPTPLWVKTLSQSFLQSDSQQRLEMARFLMLLKDPQAVNALKEGLKDKDSQVRKTIAEGFACSEDQRTVPALISCLDDPDDGVRKACLQTLSRIKAKQSIAPMGNVLKRDNDLKVRMEARNALNRMLVDYPYTSDLTVIGGSLLDLLKFFRQEKQDKIADDILIWMVSKLHKAESEDSRKWGNSTEKKIFEAVLNMLDMIKTRNKSEGNEIAQALSQIEPTLFSKGD